MQDDDGHYFEQGVIKERGAPYIVTTDFESITI